MSKKDEALKLALEALEDGQPDDPYPLSLESKAITAIREALAEQPAQQQDGPINEGWQITVAHGHSGYGVYAHMEDYPEEGAVLVQAIEQPEQCRHRIADARNPVVKSGYLCVDCGALFAAANHTKQPAIKQDLTPEQPAQQQEPVYFCDYGYEGWGKVDADMAAANLADGMTVEAYYTSTPASKPWVGLTDEEIKRMAAPWFLSMYWKLCVSFGRTIEAKLREKNA